MKKKSYNFTLTLPPTLNRTYRSKIGMRGVYKTREAKDWQEEVGWIVKQKTPILGEVLIEIVMYLKHDRDIDSSLKLLLDTFADVGVYKNDSQIVDLHVVKMIDKTSPKVDVTITEI